MSEASKRTQDWLKENLQEVWDKEVWPILPHFCLFRFVSVDLLLVSVQSKHRNSLFRYRSETTETKVLFRIVPKLVSVLVSVVSKRNYFRRTPYVGGTGEVIEEDIEAIAKANRLRKLPKLRNHLTRPLEERVVSVGVGLK
jgi:hypothetical protein